MYTKCRAYDDDDDDVVEAAHNTENYCFCLFYMQRRLCFMALSEREGEFEYLMNYCRQHSA